MNVLVVTQLFMTLNDLKEHIVERDSLTLVFANKHLNVNRKIFRHWPYQSDNNVTLD